MLVAMKNVKVINNTNFPHLQLVAFLCLLSSGRNVCTSDRTHQRAMVICNLTFVVRGYKN